MSETTAQIITPETNTIIETKEKKVVMRCENVCKEFHSGGDIIKAVNNVNVDILAGELVIFKGRSGSGKTTLMNVMGTLDEPTSGKIFLNDTEISSLSRGKKVDIRRKNMGFVFQSVGLMSRMTAFENVEIGLRVAGISFNERKRRVEECLTILGLGKRMHHMATELSGGEQQRVGIARAIAHKPSIIFADEPTAELDTANSYHIVSIFKNLINEYGVTIIMTTHNLDMLNIADKIYTMSDGVLS